MCNLISLPFLYQLDMNVPMCVISRCISGGFVRFQGLRVVSSSPAMCRVTLRGPAHSMTFSSKCSFDNDVCPVYVVF